MPDNEYFLTEMFVEQHVTGVETSPLEPRYNLSYLREAIQGCRTVLDVGCCGAQFQDLLGSFTPHVKYYGVDFSQPALNEARRRHPDAELIQADGASLPFRDGQFDLSYQRDVIMHHPDPLGMIREMYRVAKRVLFNARISPRIRYLLTLRDHQHPVLYQILPDDVLLDTIVRLCPPPAFVRFKVVEIIGTNPRRFEWNGYPHYNDILGGGEQYHVHCLVVKGRAGCRTRIVDETPSLRLRLIGLGAGYRLVQTSVRRVLRRTLFRMLGVSAFYRLHRFIKGSSR